MQVVEAVHFHKSVGGVGLAWVSCRVLWPLRVLEAQAVLENKSTNLKIHIHCPKSFKASWGCINVNSNHMRHVWPSPFQRTRNWSSEATSIISSEPWFSIQSPLNDRVLVFHCRQRQPYWENNPEFSSWRLIRGCSSIGSPLEWAPENVSLGAKWLIKRKRIM